MYTQPTIKVHDRTPRRHDNVQFWDDSLKTHRTGTVTRIGAKTIKVRIHSNNVEHDFEPSQLQVITLEGGVL